MAATVRVIAGWVVAKQWQHLYGRCVLHGEHQSNHATCQACMQFRGITMWQCTSSMATANWWTWGGGRCVRPHGLCAFPECLHPIPFTGLLDPPLNLIIWRWQATPKVQGLYHTGRESLSERGVWLMSGHEKSMKTGGARYPSTEDSDFGDS